MYHYHPGEDLETALLFVEDAHERFVLIEEAYDLLCSLPLEAVIIEDEFQAQDIDEVS